MVPSLQYGSITQEAQLVTWWVGSGGVPSWHFAAHRMLSWAPIHFTFTAILSDWSWASYSIGADPAAAARCQGTPRSHRCLLPHLGSRGSVTRTAELHVWAEPEPFFVCEACSFLILRCSVDSARIPLHLLLRVLYSFKSHSAGHWAAERPTNFFVVVTMLLLLLLISWSSEIYKYWKS